MTIRDATHRYTTCDQRHIVNRALVVRRLFEGGHYNAQPWDCAAPIRGRLLNGGAVSIRGNTVIIIESVDSISKDERGFPLTQYITNGRISRGAYTFTHFKHHHLVLRLISYSMSV